MDFVRLGFSDRSSDEQETSYNSQKEKKTYHRHTTYQINRLESFFKECPHPDENQRRQLGRELGLEPRQIKFWFQNKRTQTKTQTERADNTALRMENEKIQCENLLMRESLKNIVCPACGGPPYGEEERRHSVQQLQVENSELKMEHERVTNILAKYIGKPTSQGPLEFPTASSPGLTCFPGTQGNNNMSNMGSTDLLIEANNAATAAAAATPAVPYQLIAGGIAEMEKQMMVESAFNAREELIKLIRINEPLWVRSPTDGQYLLHRETYENIFPASSHSKFSSVAITESSKEWGFVPINGEFLFNMFWDPEKWSDLFPTIVTKAKTLQVLESGIMGNGSGSLQLMYNQLHVLSPLVATREFYTLRLCQKMEQHIWLVVDVSFDCFKDNHDFSSYHCWRLPSGCMIEEMPNGGTKVTWVEHVEVERDKKTLTNHLYRDILSGNFAFGAQRWFLTLQRMCERFTYFMEETVPNRGVISASEGKRSIMNLAHRMMKCFCSNLHMPHKLDYSPQAELNNSSGVQFAVRKNVELGQPNGIIVSASTSIWLPLPPSNLFKFLTDERQRHQWDVLSHGSSVQEIAEVTYGTHHENRVSILRPFVGSDNRLIMLQESNRDPLGSLVIYSPIDLPTLNIAINGGDSTAIPILPSGFIISGDGRRSEGSSSGGSSSSGGGSPGGGSLLTVAFQILACGLSYSKQINVESVATVNTLVCTTVQRLKAALNFPGLE